VPLAYASLIAVTAENVNHCSYSAIVSALQIYLRASDAADPCVFVYVCPSMCKISLTHERVDDVDKTWQTQARSDPLKVIKFWC